MRGVGGLFVYLDWTTRARVCVCLRGAKGVLRAVVVVGDECGVKGVL